MSVISEGHKFLSNRAFRNLAVVVERDGFYVQPMWGRVNTLDRRAWLRSWAYTFGHDESGWDDKVDAWPRAFLWTPTLDMVVDHAIHYHNNYFSHGEALGMTIGSYPVWHRARKREKLIASVTRAIAFAAKHGIDH